MPGIKKDSIIKSIIYKYGLLVLFGLHLLAVLPFDTPHSYFCYGGCPPQSIMDNFIDEIKSVEYYYPLLRFVTITIAGFYLYLLRKRITDVQYVGLIIAIVIFNPIIVPEIDRGIWVVLNLVFSIYCLFLYNRFRNNPKNALE